MACRAVLDYRIVGRGHGAVGIGQADGTVPTLVFVPAAAPKREKLRLHIDVNPTDRDQDAELQRLLELGAEPADIGQTGEEAWHVLADPEGNEFCLLHTRMPPA